MDQHYSTAGLKETLPTWSLSDEQRVMRKVDFRIIPLLILGYASLNITRINISAATIINAEDITHNMLFQLGLLDSADYNWAVSAFFFGYILFEIPSNLIILRMDPSRWIARLMILWGALSACVGAVNNFEGLLVIRILMGCAQAGFIPGVAFYLTFWYRKYEVSSRYAYIFAGAMLISSFNGVAAFGVGNIFAAVTLTDCSLDLVVQAVSHGLVATLFGVLNHIFLPSYPQTAGFMSIEEKEIVVGRLPEHARHQSAMTNIDIQDALETFRDWRMYALSFSLMFSVSAIIAIGYFLPG
ncbi:hypothetical protein HDU93_002375, partial [Gonapodya sp. JEL0774]